MVVLVGMMLSALLVPMVITQAQTTRFDAARVDAINAAQSGIDVALGLIRASATDEGFGDASKLPCGPESGNVNGTESASYLVFIHYYVSDPMVEPTPPAMDCKGFGPFDETGAMPGFALFTSTGTAGTATAGSTTSRTLITTYVFRTSNADTLGGIVRLSAQPGSDGLCMDAGSPMAAGFPVTLQKCGSGVSPAPQQLFAYRTDLTLQLVSSIITAYPNGLCVTSADKPDVEISCWECGPPDQLATPSTQQWSYNDKREFQAVDADSATTGKLGSLCMGSGGSGQPINLRSCAFDGSVDSTETWIPSASVGSGAAAVQQGTGSHQWVNYQEFSQCLAVDNQDGEPGLLVDQPCQQNPFPGAVTSSELFQAPPIPTGDASVIRPISTDDKKYCLTSPGTADGPYAGKMRKR